MLILGGFKPRTWIKQVKTMSTEAATEAARIRNEEPKLWKVDVSILTDGEDVEHAKENIMRSHLIVDDILEDIERDEFEHLKGEYRLKVMRDCQRKLDRLKRRR